MLELSGIIGITILEKNNKFYVILYDDHNNTKYCKKELNFVPELLKIFNKDNLKTSFFIEDYKENNKEYYIWDNVKHLKEFNKYLKLNKNKVNWYLTDIRLYIGNIFNIEELKINLDFLFGLDNNNINDINLIKLKREINEFLFINKLVNKLFLKLKNKYIKIRKLNQINTPLFQYFFKGYLIKDLNFDDTRFELDYIIDNLMELYLIINIIKYKKTINILYYGLFHCINIVNYLKTSGCKTIYEDGVVESKITDKFLIEKLEKDTKSCIILNKNN